MNNSEIIKRLLEGDAVEGIEPISVTKTDIYKVSLYKLHNGEYFSLVSYGKEGYNETT